MTAAIEYDLEDLIGQEFSYSELGWSSDWNGYELGYDHIPVVGLYHILETDIWVYINTEDCTVLEAWREEEEE